MADNRYIEVLYKMPNEKAKRIRIENTLEDMQKLVKGYLEILRYNDVFIVCNKERNEKKIEPNIVLENNMIFGSFFLVGDDSRNADFISLKEGQFRKYKREMSKNFVQESEMECELE